MSTEFIEPTVVVLDEGREQYQLMLDLSPEQIVIAIDDLLQTYPQENKEANKPSMHTDLIFVKTGCGFTRQYDRIELADIAYITTNNRKSFLCLKNSSSFEVDIHEEDVARCFPATKFIRVRSKEIINVDYIQSINDYSITALDGHILHYYAKYKPFLKNQLCLLGTYQKKEK